LSLDYTISPISPNTPLTGEFQTIIKIAEFETVNTDEYTYDGNIQIDFKLSNDGITNTDGSLIIRKLLPNRSLVVNETNLEIFGR